MSHPTAGVPSMSAPTICRNAPCPCRSGRKFKRCCYRKSQSPGKGMPLPARPSARIGTEGELLPPSLAPRGMLASTPVERRTWQQVHVVLDTADGKRVHAVLLHSDGWLRAHRVAEGRAFT